VAYSVFSATSEVFSGTSERTVVKNVVNLSETSFKSPPFTMSYRSKTERILYCRSSAWQCVVERPGGLGGGQQSGENRGELAGRPFLTRFMPRLIIVRNWTPLVVEHEADGVCLA
jgi:hypothetical protein